MATTISGPRVLPGPRRQRVLGSWRYLRSFDHDPLSYLEALFARYGPVLELADGAQPVVLALGAAANAELLARPDLFGPAREPLVAPGSHSAVLRQLVAGQPTPGEIEIAQWWHASGDTAAYLGIVARCAEATVARWGIGRQIDAPYVMRLLALRGLTQAIGGIDSFADPVADRALQRWAASRQFGFHPLLRHLPGFVDRERERTLARCAAELGDRLTIPGLASDPASIAPAIEQIDRTAEIITSIASWSVLLLSQFPRVLSDVAKQVQAADGDLSRDRLPLLHRVILESLRLFPPRALVLRQTRRRGDLLGYAVPAGSLVVASPYLTHRLAEIFVGPKRFRPERWLYVTPELAQFLPLLFDDSDLFTLEQLTDQVRSILAVILRRHYLALAVGAQIDRSLRPILLPHAELPMIVAPLDRPVLRRDVHGNVRDMLLF